MDAKKWPIDLDAVEKGDHFSVERLRKIFGPRDAQGRPIDDNKLRLLTLGLKERIEEHCHVTCKVNDSGLFVLTDEQAVVHNQQIFRQAQRQMGRRFELSSRIDISALSPNTKQRHLDGLVTQGRVLQAIRRANREVKAELAAQQPKTLQPSEAPYGHEPVTD